MANDVLPLPLGPQKTLSDCRGMSTSTLWRLCCDAPRTTMGRPVTPASAGMDRAVPFMRREPDGFDLSEFFEVAKLDFARRLLPFVGGLMCPGKEPQVVRW